MRHIAQARFDHAILFRARGHDQRRQHARHRTLEVHCRVERLSCSLVGKGIAEDCRYDADAFDEINGPISLPEDTTQCKGAFDASRDPKRYHQRRTRSGSLVRSLVERGFRRKIVEAGHDDRLTALLALEYPRESIGNSFGRNRRDPGRGPRMRNLPHIGRR
jgi:hypothetical protein